MHEQTPSLTDLLRAARELAQQADRLDFSAVIPWVYNPLDYAWPAHAIYLSRYAQANRRCLFLGMNPGPWGMAQTGVPFGEVRIVREFLGINAEINKPRREHPKRRIEGLACGRSEVSGRRLWGLFQERFVTAERFFEGHFVANYCPLVFMDDSARNVTPDKLPISLRQPLESICDLHLVRLIRFLQPQYLIGVGGFAENCCRRVCLQHQLEGVEIGRILHPSPASPAANRDWAGTATRQLQELGVW